MLDQALLRQQAQRLTHRSSADAEIGTQSLLDDLRPGGESTGEYRVADTSARHVDQTFGEVAVFARPVAPGHALLVCHCARVIRCGFPAV